MIAPSFLNREVMLHLNKKNPSNPLQCCLRLKNPSMSTTTRNGHEIEKNLLLLFVLRQLQNQFRDQKYFFKWKTTRSLFRTTLEPLSRDRMSSIRSHRKRSLLCLRTIYIEEKPTNMRKKLESEEQQQLLQEVVKSMRAKERVCAFVCACVRAQALHQV